MLRAAALVGFGGKYRTYRYFRLDISKYRHAGSDAMGAGTDVRVSEMALYVGATTWPLSVMTGPSSPAPYVVVADSELNASFQAWGAFNGDVSDGSRWISGSAGGPHWLQFDAGSHINITSYAFSPDSVGGSGYHCVDWRLLGSKTGAFAGEELALDTQANITAGWTGNTLRTFTVP